MINSDAYKKINMAFFQQLYRYRQKILGDLLYKNSIFIYFNTVVAALFGFLFWMFAARLYTAEAIGVASALVSMAGIIANLSGFGLQYGLIRFLPGSSNKEELFSSALFISLFGVIVFCSLFIGKIDIFSPSFKFLSDMHFALIFLLVSLFQISSYLVNNGLLAMRRAEYSFAQNLSLGIRLILLAFFTFAGALGIFLSIGMAYFSSFVMGIILLFKLKIKIKFRLNVKALKEMVRFSLINYINDFVLIAEASILPVIALNNVGAKEAGYFYVAFSIASLLYAIPYSIFTSMFVEGSHGAPLKQNTIKSLKLAVLLMIPCGIALFLLGDQVLSLFSKEYSENAFGILKLLTLSSFFLTINLIFLSLKRVKKDIKSIFLINLLLLLLTSVLSYYLTTKLGIIGLGLGWSAGQGITSIVVLIMITRETIKGKLF